MTCRHLPCLTAPLLAALIGLAQPNAQAQAMPSAGSLLQEEASRSRAAPAPRAQLPDWQPAAAPQAPAAQPGAVLQLRGLRFAGNDSIAEGRLAALLGDLPGREVSLADLQQAIGRITALYQREDFPLARAYLPAQDIVDGIVEIKVVEGRLGEVKLVNRSGLNDAQLRAYLAPLHSGAALRGADLERSLLLLRQLAGTEVRGTLAAGPTPGSSDLIVEALPANAPPSMLALDNQGNRHSGLWRLAGRTGWDNPLHRGDALNLQLSSSGAALRHARLAYQLPVGADGWQLAANWSELAYRLGEEFAALDARGTASGLGASAQYPLLRSRRASVQLAASVEHKRLVDRIAQADLASQKQLDIVGLSLSGDALDALLDNWSITLAAGRLELDPDSAALDALDARSAGRFARLNWSAGKAWWLPALGEGWSLAAQAGGQQVLSRRSLDSAEKFSLGGPQAVRAYAQGESPCDDAMLINLDLRWRTQEGWQLGAFVDGSIGRPIHSPTAASTANSRRLSGFGISAANQLRAGLSWTTSLAWRTGDAPRNAADRSVQLWASLQGQY